MWSFIWRTFCCLSQWNKSFVPLYQACQTEWEFIGISNRISKEDFSNFVWFPVFCLIAGERWWWLWRGGWWARGRWRWWRRRWWHRQMISFTSSVYLYQLSFSVNTLYKVVQKDCWCHVLGMVNPLLTFLLVDSSTTIGN